MKISINSHASVRLETAQGVIYFDPFRIKKSPNDADYIFVTHSHFDHFSPDDIKKIVSPDSVLIVPETMYNEVAESGIKFKKVVGLAPCTEETVGEIKVEAIPAYNTNKPMHQKAYGWLGYVVTVEGKRIYVCGDMDATEEGKNVDCDIAFVPVGGTYTMNAEEAAAFVNEMKPQAAIPYHYGSIVGGKNCGEKFKALVNREIEVKVIS